MNKSKGAVELKGERLGFLFFHLKGIVFFFLRELLGWAYGVLLLIDGRAQVYLFIYLHLVVESRSPLQAQIHIYKYIYIYIYTRVRIHTYTHTCIYIHIYIFMREGGSSNAEAQNHELSQNVI